MDTRMKRTAPPLVVMSAILLSLAGANVARGAAKVTTVAVPDGGQPMAAKVDAQGTIHLLFQSSDGPHYAKSTDKGKTFGKAIAVVDRESRKPGLEFSVWDMAIGTEGRVHVAMGTNAWKLKLPKDEWGFFYARLDPGTPAFTPVRNINGKPSEGF